MLFAGSTMAATYFYSPYSNPKNHTAFLINLADPTNEDDRIALKGASCNNGSRAITSNPISIVDGVSKIAPDTNNKLYYIKFDKTNSSFTFSIAKKSNFSVVFTSPSNEGSLVLSSIAYDNSETPIETVAANSKLAIFTLSKELEAGNYKLAYSNKEMDIFEILLVEAASTDDATLKSITVNNIEVEGFDAATTAYDVVLPFGTTEVPVVAATATSANATVTITQATAVNGSASILVTAEDNTTTKTYTIKFSVAAASQDATLSAITVDGDALEGFSPEQLTYSMELAYGTTIIPTVTATTTDKKATCVVKYVDAEGAETTSLPCTATITVTAEDGSTQQTYSISFTVAETQSQDATLASISIDGTAIKDFKSDSLDYTYTIAYAATTIPTIIVVVNDETANWDITQAETVPGTATIVVTAQAGNTQTYTVTISRAAAIKHLTVVPFANGAKGAIDETSLTITAPYLTGTDVPTVDGEHIAVSGDGTPTATLSEDGATITLKGDDNVEAVYSVVTKELAPDTLTADLITFTGTEKYIFAPYGFASDKGWKFAKKVNDESNMRDASGNTRIYMALPPAESVKLTSGSSGARDVVIYINGAKSSVTKTAAKDESITLELSQTQNNFVAIESNQTSGDGGFTKMQLVNPSNPISTTMEQAPIEVKAVKVLRNGQLLIIREGRTYTAQGIEVQ